MLLLRFVLGHRDTSQEDSSGAERLVLIAEGMLAKS